MRFLTGDINTLVSEESVISTDNYQLGKEKGKEKKNPSYSASKFWKRRLSCRFLAPRVLLDTFLVYGDPSKGPGIRVSSKEHLKIVHNLSLGETDQIPRNIYLLGCRCFSIFEVILFTDNSVTNSIQIIFWERVIEKA